MTYRYHLAFVGAGLMRDAVDLRLCREVYWAWGLAAEARAVFSRKARRAARLAARGRARRALAAWRGELVDARDAHKGWRRHALSVALRRLARGRVSRALTAATRREGIAAHARAARGSQF